MLQEKAGQSVFSETDIQVVTKAMLDGTLFAAAQQYVVTLVTNHPTVSSTNRTKIIKNVKATKAYLGLISLMTNTLSKFNRVKDGEQPKE